MTKPLISVIVPIYKVEPYLRQCVDSIINQTYQNLEIILIDDGSPDNCGAICDEYAARDHRVHVIHKPNGGLSDARNVGLDIMQGEYLSFADSDDWLPEDAIEVLYELIRETDADLAIGSSDRMDEHGEKLPAVENIYQAVGTMDRTAAMKDMLMHGCSAWARLYKREIHENIRFPKGEINEDEAIVLEILNRCDRVATTDRVVYHYLCRSESITTNSFSKKKLNWQAHCKENLSYVKEKYPDLTQYAAARYCGSLMWSVSEIAMLDDPSEYRAEIEEMMDELKANKALFDTVPFALKHDKVRYDMLKRIGFGVYRAFLRIKRNSAK